MDSQNSTPSRLRQLANIMAAKPSAPDLPSILSQLTVEEKASLLAGADFWTTNAIPRLGVPKLKVSDGPNGARGAKFYGGISSACFPASVSLAATFDRELAEKIGKALGEETKTKGAHVLLGPTVCPHRDPRGGRNFESFSEDPYLAGELASHYITGLQREGVGATVKHYAANEQETRRFTVDARVSQRALREIYLKPFEIAVKKADPWAIMTSYNLINGTHADANEFLLIDVLRKQWGFKGLVMSDWGGTNTVAQSLTAGLDLEMPGPPMQRTLENVSAALESGELSETTLDRRAKAVLELLVKTGKFEHPEIPDEKAIDRPEHQQLIRQAGAEGMVLLKNEKNILPIDKSKVRSIALVGLAKEYLGHGGGSAAVNSHRKVTPYQAFQDAVGQSVKLDYAEGARIIRNLPPFSSEDVLDDTGIPGFTLQLSRSSDEHGKATASNVTTAQLQSIEITDISSAILTGTYKPTKTATEYISLACVGSTKVFINDEILFANDGEHADVMAFMLGTATDVKKPYDFVAGQEYRIRVVSHGGHDTDSGFSLFKGKIVGFRIGKMLQSEHDADLIPEAVETAKNSDVAIVFVGNTPTWETEGCDRKSMDLPRDGSLDRLVSEIARVNPNTIVVNSSGSPITMPWLPHVSAVLQAWFPGQEAGHAIADVVFGVVNPSGKLPVTFPVSVRESPAYENFPGDVKNDRVEYNEGIFIGYRHYDRYPQSVLFPFGFGLSYSSFSISNTKLSTDLLAETGSLEITVNVKNTGSTAGSEVVQVYVGAAFSSHIDRPKKILAGFSKVNLQPSEAVDTYITIGRGSLAYWKESKNQWSVDAGSYKAYIGTSSVDLAATLDFQVTTAYDFEP